MTQSFPNPVKVEEDGWIEWSGGPCPVRGTVAVDVRRRDGSAFFGFLACRVAGRWSRADHERHTDIIAYRVVRS